MTYSISQLIDSLGDNFPALLNAVLTRIPVVVVGEDIELIDDLTESLIHLCPHRQSLLFWRDFTTEEEILAVWEEEKHDYNVSRTIVYGFSANLRLAIDRITQFAGWILSVPLNARILGILITDATLQSILDTIIEGTGNCGVLRVGSPSSMTFSLVRPSSSSLEVEKRIIMKILKRKQQSLERIRRLLKKSLRSFDGSAHIMEVVLNLDDESEKITSDVFDEEISSYVHAAKRAVTLLSRIRLARELGASTLLTERSLYEAVGWEGGALRDFIQFMHAEWHEDFSDCVKNGALSGLGAWVDSMWGT